MLPDGAIAAGIVWGGQATMKDREFAPSQHLPAGTLPEIALCAPRIAFNCKPPAAKLQATGR